jgi:PKD repeat protein
MATKGRAAYGGSTSMDHRTSLPAIYRMWGRKPAILFIGLLLLISFVAADSTTGQIIINGSTDARLTYQAHNTSFLGLIRTNLTATAVANNPSDYGYGGRIQSDVGTPNYYWNARYAIQWQTSKIPANVNIKSVVIMVKGASSRSNSLGTFNATIIDAKTLWNNGSFYATDYSNTTFMQMAPWLTYAAFNDSAFSYYNNFTLTNLTTINTAGNTTFMFVGSWDSENITPTWATNAASYFYYYSLNNAIAMPASMVVNYVPTYLPNVAFTTSTYGGEPPLTVNLNDISTVDPGYPIAWWNWTLGDGTVFNTTDPLLKNITKVYSTRGTYSVTLTTANSQGYNASTVNIQVGLPARYRQGGTSLPNGHIFVAGGYYNPSSSQNNDTWRSTTNGYSWEIMNVSSGWSARGQMSIVPYNNNLILFAGTGSAGSNNDTWQSSDEGATWQLMNPSSGWDKRYAQAAVVLSNGHITMSGGLTSVSSFSNDTWRSIDGGATWQLMNPSSGWAPREHHKMVALSDNTIILLSGYTSQTPNRTNDIWKSTDEGATWTNITNSPPWVIRDEPFLVRFSNDNIILTNGNNENIKFCNDTWSSMDKALSWANVVIKPIVPAREWSPSIVTPSDVAIVVAGTSDGTNGMNEVWDTFDKGIHWYEVYPTNTASWNWSFGDGTYDSLNQSPTHTYTSPGTYTVALTATGAGPVTAAFSGTPTVSATAPLTVQFTDASTFGSGATDTNTATKPGYIYIGASRANFVGTPLSGNVPLTVQFTDLSTNAPTSWLWDFGDGSTSTLQNPAHTYTIARGSYNVNLTATNYGSESNLKTNYVTTNGPLSVKPLTPLNNSVAGALTMLSIILLLLGLLVIGIGINSVREAATGRSFGGGQMEVGLLVLGTILFFSGAILLIIVNTVLNAVIVAAG